MHIEYAAEVYKSRTQPKYSPPSAPHDVIAGLVTEPEFLALADKLDDEKVRGIAATLRKNYNPSVRFQKATPKQRNALALALLEKHGTPLAVYAAAMGVSETEFLAIVEEV